MSGSLNRDSVDKTPVCIYRVLTPFYYMVGVFFIGIRLLQTTNVEINNRTIHVRSLVEIRDLIQNILPLKIRLKETDKMWIEYNYYCC